MSVRIAISSVVFILVSLACGEETLGPLVDGKAPQTFADLWEGYDPRAEPLDLEILREWEEDGVVVRVIRYRVGIFKGEKAMVAGIYGFPKESRQLPGLLQIHGGGQYADSKAVVTNAKRGYATLSLSWAGRISSSEYRVSPNEVKLFWEGKTDDPAYRVITDWGALDAYHAPSRHGLDAFATIRDGLEDWTFDDVESPRNNSWFLCTMAARRGLTFLEQQPEVDGDRLGVYGHSMGGKLTVATTGTDKRVKAAAPSCGGISDRYNANPLYNATVGDAPALAQIGCPIIFLKPANDFHGRISNMVDAVEEIGDVEWRVTSSAHLNHQDYASSEVATQLWMDQHLKKKFSWPVMPKTELTLKADGGISHFSVRPDTSVKILEVDVYYTQQGQEGKGDHHNHIHQFWHHAVCEKISVTDWRAKLPVFTTEKPLWVYANVLYELDEPVAGAGYYYQEYSTDTFNLSSLVEIVTPEQLVNAGAKPTLSPSLVIEDFTGDWKKDWFNYRPDEWTIRTNKIYHPMWKAPEGATLVLEVQSEKANQLVLGIDDYAAEVSLKESSDWQTLRLSTSDLTDASGEPMKNWEGIRQLRLLAAEHLRKGRGDEQVTRRVGSNWNGAPPKFRDLRWEK